MNTAATIAVGLLVTLGAIVGQLILPFAFDFISTLAVFGVGVMVGRKTQG